MLIIRKLSNDSTTRIEIAQAQLELLLKDSLTLPSISAV